MVSFKFTLATKPASKNEKIVAKYTVIERDCEGFIINDNGTYRVKYKDKLYPITSESYKTKGRKNIYARWKDKFNHRIKFIRDKDYRPKTDTRFYIPICDGLICKGKLVKTAFNPILFHIKVCYNPADVEGASLALKEWLDYKEKIKYGKIDERNEL